MTVKTLRQPTKKLLQHSLIAAALLSLSSPASALNLSELTLKSQLHQPFSASISLRNFDPVEVDRISVEIANDMIQGRHDSSNYLPIPLSAALKSTRSGTTIELHSAYAIDEPFLKFAVQLNSPEGLILRQYEVLLDPPKTRLSAAQKTVKRPSNRQPMPATVEKFKSSVQLAANARAQGIEIAPAPETAALSHAQEPTPSPQGISHQEPVYLGAVPALQSALTSPSALTPHAIVMAQAAEFIETETVVEEAPQTAALISTPKTFSVPVEKLYLSKEMDDREFIAALEKYSLANMLAPTRRITPAVSSGDSSQSSDVPKTAALSRTPAAAPQKKVYDTIPAGVSMGQGSSRFAVSDGAFSSKSADSIASALMAYRERLRAGGEAGFHPNELVKYSASSVNRVSNTTAE